MKRAPLLTAAAALCLGAMAATSAVHAAMPMGDAKAGRTTSSMIDLVKGGHRSCERHYVPRWDTRASHRHAGPRNLPEGCGRQYKERPRDYDKRGCFKAGPVYFCP